MNERQAIAYLLIENNKLMCAMLAAIADYSGDESIKSMIKVAIESNVKTIEEIKRVG